MIDREHKLSVVRQAKLLGFSRGSVYYSPRPVSDGDLALMRRIDELHLDYPFAGSRMLQGLLRGEGLQTGRLHVATLMKKMGIEAIYRRPNTPKPAPGPLWTGSAGRSCRGDCRSRWSQPSASKQSRKRWPVMADPTYSIPTGLAVHLDGLHGSIEESRNRHLDGWQGAWRDNVFVEGLWRSIKYEEVYLHAYKTVSEARVGIGRYLTFYNPVS